MRRLAAKQAAGDDSDIDYSDIPKLTPEQLAADDAAARAAAQGCGERAARSGGTRLAEVERRGAPDTDQRYFD
jgi:hypothetical protein